MDKYYNAKKKKKRVGKVGKGERMRTKGKLTDARGDVNRPGLKWGQRDGVQVVGVSESRKWGGGGAGKKTRPALGSIRRGARVDLVFRKEGSVQWGRRMGGGSALGSDSSKGVRLQKQQGAGHGTWRGKKAGKRWGAIFWGKHSRGEGGNTRAAECERTIHQ